MSKVISNSEKEMLKILSEGGKHYFAYSGYRKGWGAVAKDKTNLAENLLKELEIKFKIGNDAPRGGLNGKFIKNSKFNFDKALKKIENTRLEEKYFFEGKRYAEQIYKKKIELFCKAIFGICDFETSQSGNIYGIYQKPTRRQVESGEIPSGLRRITAGGELQIFKDGNWTKNF